MLNFTVSIYPTRDQRFLASFIHPLNKRRIREYFSSKDAATKFKLETENRFKKSKPESYQELNIDELLVLFMQDNPKSDFRKSKIHMVDFIETFGKFKIYELNEEQIKMWFDQVQAENSLKDTSMRSVKCSIDVFFRYLANKEIISESPLANIYYKKETPAISARNILSPEEINEILKKSHAFSPGYLYPILKILAETAAKPSEIMDMTWKQIHLEEKEIIFTRTDKIQERRVKISNELSIYFEKNKKSNGLVFITYYKEPFTRNKLRRLIEEFKVKTNSKIKWTPMDFRHSYAVNFLLERKDIKRLQYLLGHNNVHDTKKLYGEVLTKKSKEQIFSSLEIGS